MRTTELSVDTSERVTVDITDAVAAFAAGAGDGLLTVFVPHATAGVAVMETGSGSDEDLAEALQRLLPRDERYHHRQGSRGHGADHVLPAFIAPSVTIPVVSGELQLGTWQRVVLVDTNADNPRRRVRCALLEG